jgi:hypothetical protein
VAPVPPHGSASSLTDTPSPILTRAGLSRPIAVTHASLPDLRHLRSVPDTPCPVSEEQAHALLDGELDAAQASRVRDHLAQCRDCRANVGRLRRFLALLRHQRRNHLRAPTSLHARVRALRAPTVPVVGPDLHPPDATG